MGYKMAKERHLNVRIDDELLKKFRYAASYEGRSANGQILIMIRRFITEFENAYGVISFPSSDEHNLPI